MRIVNELESIGDSCYKLMIIANKQKDQNLTLHETAVADLKPYEELVSNFIADVVFNLTVKKSNYKIADAQSTETKINSYRSSLKRAARRQIQEGSDVKAELLYIDMVRQMEQIGDFCMNIMQEMANMK